MRLFVILVQTREDDLNFETKVLITTIHNHAFMFSQSVLLSWLKK